MNNKKSKEFQTNIYAMTVQFPELGIIIDDTEANTDTRNGDMHYHEEVDYIGNKFPTRVLTIKLYPTNISKLVNYRRSLRTNSKSLFNIELMVRPVGFKGKSLLKPFKDGKFKAVMAENDKLKSYYTKIDLEKRLQRNVEEYVEITFFLFREEELQFGLSNNLNFLYKNTSLQNMFAHLFTKSNPTTKFVVSKFDHNPIPGKFLIPTMSLRESFRLLNDEFGFYKTGMMEFLENNTYYFLNTANDMGVTCKKLESIFRLNVIKEPGDNSPKMFSKSKVAKEMIVNINASDIDVYTDSKSIVDNQPIYVNASGEITGTNNTSARDVDTVRKITNIPNLVKDVNVSYEYITLSVRDISSIDVNPFTRIEYFDNSSNLRNYRVCKKETEIRSNKGLINTIVGMRII